MADIPESIGKYKIISLVAKGGMGAVFKAVHPTLKRNVIIKKLTIRGNAAILERFKREAQILMDLNDPRIVKLFDYFKEGNSHYIVLEHVDGMSLDMLLKKRRYLSGALSLYVFLDVCRALKYAHDNGVIHRDIKPGNILISKNGAIKLADFGIAATADGDEEGLTKEGTTLGTPSYMPPEQINNSKNVTKSADIYAMGVMLYEMVTGKKAFPGNFSAETLMLIQKGKYPAARKVNPDTPKIITKLLRKMIRPNPRKRYQDMAPVIKTIKKYLSRYQKEAILQCLVDCMGEKDFVEPVFKPRRKKRVTALVASALILALAGASYYAWNAGYVQRYALPDSYGAIRISVRVPQSVKDRDDIFVKARLFIHDRAEYPESDMSPVNLIASTADADQYAYRFQSRTLYLKPGPYRLKVFVEGRIYWYTFKALPISALSARKETEQDITLTVDQIETKTLTVKTETFDAISGKNLSAQSSYSILEGDQWVPLAGVPEGSLVTGRVLKFRAENEGYYPEIFSLKIAPYQSELRLHANLVPLPGSLTVDTGSDAIRITLNGSERIILGGEDMSEGTLADFKGGKKTWNLPSGRYEIAASDGKNRVTSTFTLASDEPIMLKITSDGNLVRIDKE